MLFPISGTHLSLIFLVGIGFVIGLLGGFFGVGGSFLAGPALFAAGVPMNFVVGTDLAHIVGKSIVAAKSHHTLGHVDLKLGGIMTAGTLAGVEVGAQAVEYLKRRAHVDLGVALGFIVILVGISGFVGWESWQTLKWRRHRAGSGKSARELKRDETILDYVHKRVRRFHLPPTIRLPVSGIDHISLWTILAVGFVGGVFSGFLGGGAGYLRMPALIYLLGVPTHVAVGTDLFEVVISAGYGTFTHAVKGNVDILIALVMHTGAALGARIGAMLTDHVHGVRIRLAFVPLPLVGAGLVVYGLLTGNRLK